ncbi:MAG: hypothetical protein ACI8UD_001424 [Planctomycetota bacterium]|jgi:hypothetical protein
MRCDQGQQGRAPHVAVAKLLIQLRPHALKAALQLRAHGRERTVELGRNFARLEVFEVSQQHHGVVRLRQFEQRVDDPLVHRSPLGRISRVGVAHIIARHHLFAPRPAAFLASKAARDVARNLGKPSLRSAQFARRTLNRLKHGLLRDVIGARRIGYQAARERAHPFLVAEQNLKAWLASSHSFCLVSATDPRDDSAVDGKNLERVDTVFGKYRNGESGPPRVANMVLDNPTTACQTTFLKRCKLRAQGMLGDRKDAPTLLNLSRDRGDLQGH